MTTEYICLLNTILNYDLHTMISAQGHLYHILGPHYVVYGCSVPYTSHLYHILGPHYVVYGCSVPYSSHLYHILGPHYVVYGCSVLYSLNISLRTQ